jgi:hypothetical protein
VVQDKAPVQEEQSSQPSSIGFIPEVDVPTEETVEIPETDVTMPAIELPQVPSETENMEGPSTVPAIPAE